MNRIARMGAVFKAKRKQNPVGCLHPDWAAYRLEQPSVLRTSSGSARRGGRRGSVSRSTACRTASCAEPLDTEQAWDEHGRRSAALAAFSLNTPAPPETLMEETCCGLAIHVGDTSAWRVSARR